MSVSTAYRNGWSRSGGRMILAAIAVMLWIWGCLPPEKQAAKSLRTGLDDPGTRAILDLSARKSLDSLAAYVHDEDPTYRYHAAMAMGSVGDSTMIDSLKPLLSDPVVEVRLAAVFALGQTRSARAELPLLEAFDPWDSLGRSTRVNAAILEAVGKCGSAQNLANMVSVTTYAPTDSLYQIGLANGIWQYALRKIVHPAGTRRMIEILADPQRPELARLLAAGYLSRTAGITVDTLVPELVNQLRAEQDPEMRMALALAIGRSGSELARSSLVGLYPLEKDDLVRATMIKGLAHFPYTETHDILRKAFRDPHPYVGMVAADVLNQVADPKDTPEWLILAREIRDPWVRASMYVAVSRLCPVSLPVTRTAIQSDLKKALSPGTGDYLQVLYLKAMGKFGWNFPSLMQTWRSRDVPAVRTAAAEALADISERADFNAIFGVTARNVRRNLAAYFLEMIGSGDAGSVAVAATALRDPGYRPYVQSDTLFRKAMNLCQWPQDLETYNELAETRQFFWGSKVERRALPLSRPVDWAIMDRIKEQTRAVIRTGKGNVIIRFMPELAPGSTTNFIRLAESGFFKGKVFHRVVPQFVIQAGCPRGDGYGALGYTLISELSPQPYDRPGLIGMASAGLHTESTQFFITQSPTLHLNGRYSLFAEVETGMDVVNRILPGDEIQEVEIIY